MDSHAVDIVIAVHTPTRPIERAVASVLTGNSVSAGAIVVVHNTESQPIVERLGDLAHDPRVTIAEFRDGRHSPAGPMNHGFDLATAPFVSLLGSDDTLEPGALDSWVEMAERPGRRGADFVIAARKNTGVKESETPPVRVGRRLALDGAKDRLAYRAAPLGLLRREALGSLRFSEGVQTGEDIAFSAGIWFSGARIAFAFDGPGYLVHDDQTDRVTSRPRPVDVEFRWLDEVLDPDAVWMRSDRYRLSLLLKLLRTNVIDACRIRLDVWDAQTGQQMREVVQRILSCEPRGIRLLSRADRAVVTALLRGDSSGEELRALVDRRGKTRSLAALVPSNALLAAHRQGPLRYHLATLLLNTGRRD